MDDLAFGLWIDEDRVHEKAREEDTKAIEIKKKLWEKCRSTHCITFNVSNSKIFKAYS